MKNLSKKASPKTKSRHSKHEEIIGGKIVMVRDKHEHIWQLHQHGFSEGYATFFCHCGAYKIVKKRNIGKIKWSKML